MPVVTCAGEEGVYKYLRAFDGVNAAHPEKAHVVTQLIQNVVDPITCLERPRMSQLWVDPIE